MEVLVDPYVGSYFKCSCQCTGDLHKYTSCDGTDGVVDSGDGLALKPPHNGFKEYQYKKIWNHLQVVLLRACDNPGVLN